MSERGLYVHIPFCRRKCHYCNYTIWVGAGEEDRERFFRALAAEAVRAAERYGPLAFDTLYFGGGTPSLLLADEFRRVAEILRKHFRFRPGAEFTCEANPGDVDATRLAAWRREGMNRVSLGIQSFDDHLLRLMGRAHDRAAALEAVRALGGAGFDNVSFDLILRLPGQTPAGAREALEEAVRLGPRQVVLYDLNVHEGTVFGRRAREGKLDLPSEALHEAMFAAAEEVLVRRAGFRHYEVSTFARPGYEARHNLIYWRNGEYLGLGPGAFSYMQGVRYQFARSVASYLAKCGAGDASNDEEDRLTPEEIEMETFLTGLRLDEGVDPSRFPAIGGHLRKELASLESLGLTECEGGRVRLSAKGRRLAETVFMRLSLPQKSPK